MNYSAVRGIAIIEGYGNKKDQGPGRVEPEEGTDSDILSVSSAEA
jgi:hypothetical protein